MTKPTPTTKQKTGRDTRLTVHEKNTGGRKTKLTPEVHARIVEMMSRGYFAETAAATAGINARTLRKWLAKGARLKAGPFREFTDAVVAASAVAEHKAIDGILAAGDFDPKLWQAYAWFLTHRHPERWGAKNKVEVSGPDGGPIETVNAQARVVDKLARLAGEAVSEGEDPPSPTADGR